MGILGRLWGLMVLVWLAGPLAAAEPGLSVLRIDRATETGGLDLTLSLDTADVVRLVPLDANGDGLIEASEVAASDSALRSLGSSWVSVSVDGEAVGLRLRGVAQSGPGGDWVWRFALGREPVHALTLLFKRLAELPVAHVQTVQVGAVEVPPLRLSGADAMCRIDWATAGREVALPLDRNGDAPGFWAFFKLGVEHILIGYDHLLFLAGLLLVCQRGRAVLVVITSFTVAHSLTLGAAALDWISAPARVVEPLIAASIVFVGVENIWRGGTPKARWAVTFLFGLIHGFGFAGVLRELGLGLGGVGLLGPLAGFNLGVEVGQLAVAAVILPVFWALRKRPGFERRWIPWLSGLVALMGLYWLIERLVG